VREQADIVIVGAGAAGLMSAVWAGRAARDAAARPRIIALDGARKVGVKILVAGGGRCNVTHHEVREDAYAGASRHAIRKVLRRFDVPDTVRFFESLGVRLKREPNGKLFPTTDDAHTVLDALLHAVADARVELRNPARVESVRSSPEQGFTVSGPWGDIDCRRVILATGGKALPRSGSDGGGYSIARALGHTTTDRIFPALVPLALEKDCFLRTLSGVTLPARLELRAATGRRLLAFENSTLCTHFGLSGPAPMDISRYLTAARFDDPAAHLVASWLPGETREGTETNLLALSHRRVGPFLRTRLPERMADALCAHAGVDPATTGASMRRDQRRALLDTLFERRLPVAGDRGFTHAETTAGGVPLAEVDLKTMESRIQPALHLCGEILDVDGRIGGFNFQWAWASGWIAGASAGAAIAGTPPARQAVQS
jgi:predicted Rossmann fold flavoprotein